MTVALLFDTLDGMRKGVTKVKETKANGETVDRGPRELNSLDRGGWSTVEILAEVRSTETER